MGLAEALGDGIEALSRMRQAPSLAVERAEAINIVLIASVGGQAITVNADDAISKPGASEIARKPNIRRTWQNRRD